ncbi:arginine--tRNA ligase [Paenibacillus wenxiniae]|uniref:Arginine--tRNA ligase n=1 Tax=Paenibacillus wenxiniae TaxID=1636843 RepID=A0ABW4RPR9_9BACL
MITMYSLKQQAAAWLQPLTKLSAQHIISMLEVPPSSALGDLAFPCFTLAKSWRLAPQQIAAELCESFHTVAQPYASAAATGGYINLAWNRKYYAPLLLDTIALPDYAQLQPAQKQRIIIDMSSPNIAKPFGVGHLRSTVIGAALYRMYAAAGHEPISVNHIGDWGTQFGKQIVAHLRWSDSEQAAADPIGEALRVYIKFHEEAETKPELEDEARDWFRRLEQGDEEALELWRYFVKVSMEKLDLIYERLGVQFDEVLGESFYNDKMPAVVEQLSALGLLEESQGAQVVRLDELDLPPCLILKSDGTTIYPTRDLATALYRRNVMKGDRLVYVVGGEQTLHFRQVFAVLHKMGYDWANDCDHVAFGLMRINGKKMSTRKGKVVLLEQLIDEAIARAAHIIAEKNPTLPDREQVAQQIGMGAILFSDLKNARQNEIDFSLEEALSFEGETGPYVQYAHARICSILSKAGAVTDDPAIAQNEPVPEMWSDSAWELLGHLSSYREVLGRAVQLQEPSVMARYALQTARLFNQWYSRDRIIDAHPQVKPDRLALAKWTGATLERTLKLLGMAAPQEM